MVVAAAVLYFEYFLGKGARSAGADFSPTIHGFSRGDRWKGGVGNEAGSDSVLL